jgi:predicted adenylyl cyclase CyaB
MTGKEIETRFINLSPEATEQKLVSIGAKRIGEFLFQEWLFVYPDWAKGNRRLRVRTDGVTTWLTYKANPTYTIDSTQEIEITVSSAEDTIAMIHAIGIPLERHQEKKRLKYQLDNIIFDMDFWPQIPMVFEIEAPSEEEVRRGVELLGLDWKDAIFVDQKVVHKQYYGIDLTTIREYKFPTST